MHPYRDAPEERPPSRWRHWLPPIIVVCGTTAVLCLGDYLRSAPPPHPAAQELRQAEAIVNIAHAIDAELIEYRRYTTCVPSEYVIDFNTPNASAVECRFGIMTMMRAGQTLRVSCDCP